jgi:hypothetical protein
MATSQKGSAPGRTKAAPARSPVSPEEAWGPELTKLLRQWCARARVAQHAYYAKSERLRVWNMMLGIPVVIVTAVVGTSVFASINLKGAVSPHTKVFVGAISVLAAVLASIQTFTKLGESAQQHGVAGDWYAAIRRDIEQELHLPAAFREKPQIFMSRIRKEMNAAAEKAPELGERWWQAFAQNGAIKDVPTVTSRRPWFFRSPLPHSSTGTRRFRFLRPAHSQVSPAAPTGP